MAGLATIASLAGSVIGALGTMAAGKQAQATANYEAKQLERKGDEEFAAKQREAEELRREKEHLLSRQQAVAGAGGFGALDDTVIDLAGDIYEGGAYREGISYYEGQEAKKGRQMQADARRMDGEQQKKGATLSAAGTILGGIGSFAKSRAGASFRKKSNQQPSYANTSFRYG